MKALGTALLCALAGGWLGCASMLTPDRSQLPPDLIAVRYWDDEDARHRAEILADSRNPESVLAPRREGVAQLAGIESLLGLGQSEAVTQKLARYPGHIALIDPRTGEVRRLDAAPINARPLAWSDDHERLLFESSHRGGKSQIYEYDFQKGTLRTVTRGPDLHLLADYGPDGRFVVSQLVGPHDHADPAVVFTGEGGVGETARFDGLFPSTLRWSPDGRTLVYEKLVSGHGRSGLDSVVAIRDLDGEEKIIGRGKEPDLSQDGTWVVYAAQASKGLRLRRMRLDGSARAPVGNSSLDERMPAISPDGRYVAYVVEEAGQQRLYVRAFDGSGEMVICSEGAVEFPVW